MTRIEGLLPKQPLPTAYKVVGAITIVALGALATVGICCIGYKLFFKSPKAAFLAKVPEDVRDDVSKIINGDSDNAFKLPSRPEGVDPNYFDALKTRQNRFKRAICNKFSSNENIEDELRALARSARLSEELFDIAQDYPQVKQCFSKEGLLTLTAAQARGDDSIKNVDFNTLRLRCLKSIRPYIQDTISTDRLKERFASHQKAFDESSPKFKPNEEDQQLDPDQKVVFQIIEDNHLVHLQDRLAPDRDIKEQFDALIGPQEGDRSDEIMFLTNVSKAWGDYEKRKIDKGQLTKKMIELHQSYVTSIIVDVVCKRLSPENANTFKTLIDELANGRTTSHQLYLPDSLDPSYIEHLKNVFSTYKTEIHNIYLSYQQKGASYTTEDQAPQELYQAFLKLQSLKTLGNDLFNITRSIPDVKLCFSKYGLLSKESAVYPDQTFKLDFDLLLSGCQRTTSQLIFGIINFDKATAEFHEHQEEFNEGKRKRNELAKEAANIGQGNSQGILRLLETGDKLKESEEKKREKIGKIAVDQKALIKEEENRKKQRAEDFLNIINGNNLKHMKVLENPVDIPSQLYKATERCYDLEPKEQKLLCDMLFAMLDVWNESEKGSISKEDVKAKLISMHKTYEESLSKEQTEV